MSHLMSLQKRLFVTDQDVRRTDEQISAILSAVIAARTTLTRVQGSVADLRAVLVGATSSGEDGENG